MYSLAAPRQAALQGLLNPARLMRRIIIRRSTWALMAIAFPVDYSTGDALPVVATRPYPTFSPDASGRATNIPPQFLYIRDMNSSSISVSPTRHLTGIFFFRVKDAEIATVLDHCHARTA